MIERRKGDTVAIPGDYQYRALHEGHTAQRFWHEAKLVEAVRRLAPGNGDVILDIGCGSGVLAARLASVSSRVRVIGIDANVAAIEFARNTCRAPNLELRPGLLDEVDLSDVRPTKIVCLEVIEHLYREQVLALLERCRGILPRDGLMVISTPNRRSPWPLIEWTMDRLALAPRMEGEQHVSSYDPASLTALGRAAGFAVRDVRTSHLFAPWISVLSWRVAKAVHAIEARAPALGALVMATFVRR